MDDLNNISLIGRLTRDPELKNTQSGKVVVNFSLAVKRTQGSGENRTETTSFFNCVAWGKLGEIVAKYSKKGNRIGIEAHLQQREWAGADGKKNSTVEIIVDKFQNLTPKSDTQKVTQRNLPVENNPFTDDHIPF